MFHLGWACHFIADLSVSPHTVSDQIWNHNRFEEQIDVIQKEQGIHADSISRDLADYHLTTSARDLAVEIATVTRTHLWLYQDENRWSDGARVAIPLAEHYTTRLLAKFLDEVGIPLAPYPLVIHVVDMDEVAIPHAVVFYRTAGNPWMPLVTDHDGTYKMVFPRTAQIQFRPAAPGYVFEGRYTGDAPTIPQMPPQDQSPIHYVHDPSAFGGSFDNLPPSICGSASAGGARRF